MVQSVELLLAEDDERRVLAGWRALLDAGLPSQARHTAPSNRPHVTLVARPELAPESDARLPGAVAGRLPVSGRWGPVHRFGTGPWVLVRLVEPDAALRALQGEVASVCAVPPDDLTAPGRWVAHVTLARRVTAEHLPRVLEVVAGWAERDLPAGAPVAGVAVRRWDGAARREWTVGPAARQA